MDTGTDTTMAIPALGFSSGLLLFLYPLLHLRDTTITDHTPLKITPIITSRMIEFGFLDIWNTGKPRMVGKEFGYLVIGSGDRISREI